MGVIMSLGGGGLSLEKPVYTVLEKGSGYEIRRFELMLQAVAEAEVDPAALDQKDSSLFSTLAGYIGVRGPARNRQGRSISMTAPVLTDLDSPQPGLPVRKRMAFVLPRFFQSVQQAPEPTDARVRILTVPARTVAVHRFSGMTTMSDSRRRAERLALSLQADGHAPVDELDNLRKPGLGMMLERDSMRVTAVAPNSVAGAAGIRIGDTVRAVDGVGVASPQQLSSAVRSAAASGEVVVTLTKSGSSSEHFAVLQGADVSEPSAQSSASLGSRWQLARYDPPFVPAAMRTNEIWMQISAFEADRSDRGGGSTGVEAVGGKPSQTPPGNAPPVAEIGSSSAGDRETDAAAQVGQKSPSSPIEEPCVILEKRPDEKLPALRCAKKSPTSPKKRPILTPKKRPADTLAALRCEASSAPHLPLASPFSMKVTLRGVRPCIKAAARICCAWAAWTRGRERRCCKCWRRIRRSCRRKVARGH